MSSQEQFEQINGTIRLLNNFIFTGATLDYVRLATPYEIITKTIPTHSISSDHPIF